MDGMNWPSPRNPSGADTREAERAALMWSLKATLVFVILMVAAVLVVARVAPSSSAAWADLPAGTIL